MDLFYNNKSEFLCIFGIICIVSSDRSLIFYINVCVGMILLFLLWYKKNNSKNDKNDKLFDKCRKSTYDNPYGNYLIGENMDHKFCNNDEDNKDSYNFNRYNLYENSFDKTVGSTNKAIRSFYSMPITSYPNNINIYKDFINDDTLSCKTDGYCIRYNDIRFQTR